jgi:hypothetical protein
MDGREGEARVKVMEMGRALGLGAEVVGTRQLAAPGEGALLNPLVMLSGSRVR